MFHHLSKHPCSVCSRPATYTKRKVNGVTVRIYNPYCHRHERQRWVDSASAPDGVSFGATKATEGGVALLIPDSTTSEI